MVIYGSEWISAQGIPLWATTTLVIAVDRVVTRISDWLGRDPPAKPEAQPIHK